MADPFRAKLRLTEGGTLVIPAEAQKRLGLRNGAEVLLTVEGRRGTLTSRSGGDETADKSLANIQGEIDRSRHILELKEDWDGEGSPPYSQIVWRRATDFLLRYARHLLDEHHALLPTPHINPGPNGSIDLHWKQPHFELLLNFPQDQDTLAGFYGDDYGSMKIKGKIKVQDFNQGLVQWLADLL